MDRIFDCRLGLLLRSYGWRVVFLGADTPLRTLEETATTTAPDVIVLVTFDPARLESEGTTLRRLGRIAPLHLSGPGTSPEMSAKVRVPRLNGDLVDAARQLARMPNG
jgi:hypothetical protein